MCRQIVAKVLDAVVSKVSVKFAVEWIFLVAQSLARGRSAFQMIGSDRPTADFGDGPFNDAVKIGSEYRAGSPGCQKRAKNSIADGKSDLVLRKDGGEVLALPLLVIRKNLLEICRVLAGIALVGKPLGQHVGLDTRPDRSKLNILAGNILVLLPAIITSLEVPNDIPCGGQSRDGRCSGTDKPRKLLWLGAERGREFILIGHSLFPARRFARGAAV